jgi:hypothetical protein
MNTRIHIQEELNGLNSQLPSETSGTPYSVPDGYFESFAASVLSKISAVAELSAREEIAQLSPLLAGISRKMPYELPDQFFQTLDEDLELIMAEEEESVTLSLISKDMPFEVPAGYFNNLPQQVLEKLPAKDAKVIHMRSRKWMHVAVAAMFAGVIAISGLLYFNGKKNDVAVDNPKWVANKLKNVSDRDLDEFVKTTDLDAASTVTAQNKSVKTAEVKKLLQDVSDNELDAFLNQVPVAEEELAIN